MTKPISLTELLCAVGDEELGVQFLDHCLTNLNWKGDHSKLTFGTPETFTLEGTDRLGVVIWINRDRFDEVRKALLEAAGNGGE